MSQDAIILQFILFSAVFICKILLKAELMPVVISYADIILLFIVQVTCDNTSDSQTSLGPNWTPR